MATFTPKPIQPEEPVQVTITLSPAHAERLKAAGDPHTLTIAQVVEQFITWAIDTKILKAPIVKKRVRKAKTE